MIKTVNNEDKGPQEWSYFHVSAGKFISPERAYKLPSSVYASGLGISYVRVFPLYTAIVSLNAGEVTAVTFDDGCYGCVYDSTGQEQSGCTDSIMSVNYTSNSYKVMAAVDGAPYYEGDYWNKICGTGCTRCYYTQPWCLDTTKGNCVAGVNGCSCDLTIYVVFTGTDAAGHYLSSAGLRLSRFQDYSINSLLSSAQATAASALIVNDFA